MASEDSVLPYEKYGPFYDETQTPELLEEYAALIRQMVPSGGTLLDIGCGTGTLLALLQYDFEVSGVDQSPRMVEIARAKLRRAQLEVQDIRRFDLPGKFDAVTCTYDTLNHVVGSDAWAEVFRAVQQHLSPDGLFAFDVNTQGRLQRLAAGSPFLATYPNGLIRRVSVTMKRPNLSRWEIEIWKQDDRQGYSLHSDVMFEFAMRHSALLTLLNRYFRVESVRSTSSEGLDYGRSFFVCRKR